MSSDEAAYQLVWKYLLKMNRPYSVIDITTNLGKETNKAAVTRALTRMVQENKVIEKTYGKQKVYYVNQDQFSSVSDDDLKRLDSEIANLTTTLSEIQNMANMVAKEVGALTKGMTINEAKSELEKINAELPALENRLSSLRKNTVSVDPKEKAALQLLHDKYSVAWKKRKRLANDMLNAILEGYPKPKKVLMEEIPIETDEDVRSS